MVDEQLDLDLEEDQDQQEVNKVEKRIKNLSEKVKLTSQERDEFAKDKQQLEQDKANLEKEAGFFKNFNTLVTKYPGSAEFQDRIKEKVMAGYEVEDATVAVLAREGKLGSASETQVSRENPAGGSASNTIRGDSEKAITEMTREEKRAALGEREGDLLKIFGQS